ncbi:hypothetical protein AAF712_016822 [Marasmius tenuissimus]|uniref:DUF6589 domain-containing protein n=1 Tax=Marasmius tenuissimus TaxID=585030 RepID=A0ABR2Z5Q9_9AGAR
MAFSLTADIESIKFAKPAISSWAAQLCMTCAHRDLSRLTKTDPKHPEDVPAQISPQFATWEDINTFTPERSIVTVKRRAPYLYNLLKALVEPRKAGVPVPRKNRPTDTYAGRVLTAFNSFIVGHNQFVNGYLSLPMGIQLFSLQAHSDIKHFLCRIGLSVSDSTTRKCLDYMTATNREEMQQSTAEAVAQGKADKSYVFDNVQEYCLVYEGGACRTSEMKVGTSGTAIEDEDCPDGAWDLDDPLSRVIENSQSSLTVDSLMEKIDWVNYHDTQALYIAKALIDYVGRLSKSYTKSVSEHFRSSSLAIHRIPEDRRTKIQLLGTNAEQEVEIHGMKSCIADFDVQIGFTAASGDDKVLEWASGDGLTYATGQNLQKYLAPTDLGNRVMSQHSQTAQWVITS